MYLIESFATVRTCWKFAQHICDGFVLPDSHLAEIRFWHGAIGLTIVFVVSIRQDAVRANNSMSIEVCALADPGKMNDQPYLNFYVSKLQCVTSIIPKS